jgi:hypothetical protein
VRLDRLVIETGRDAFRLDFHPRLTVIAGAGALEREGLVQELVSAMGPGRPGVHLEVTTDAGDHYAVYRPSKGRARVVDVEHAVDVTHRFTDRAGRVNLLGRTGLSARDALHELRLQPADLASESQVADLVRSLATVDQGRLWDVAQKVVDRQRRMDDAVELAGGSSEDTELVAEIERCQAECEAVRAEHEAVRSRWFIVGAGAGIVIVPAAVLVGIIPAVLLTVAAVVGTVLSMISWRRVVEAEQAVEDAVRQVGANSYLSFRIQRANGLMANDHHRKKMLQANADVEAAQAEWELLAGDVPVSWAVEHRGEIKLAARELREAVGVRNPMALSMSPAERTAVELHDTLEQRLAEARSLSDDGDTLPLLLDDPLAGIEHGAKPLLLELLGRASAGQQIVYLTDDEDVAAWARLEALTGHIAVIEPEAARTTHQESRRHLTA